MGHYFQSMKTLYPIFSVYDYHLIVSVVLAFRIYIIVRAAAPKIKQK